MMLQRLAAVIAHIGLVAAAMLIVWAIERELFDLVVCGWGDWCD
jgi:hypothetical protein